MADGMNVDSRYTPAVGMFVFKLADGLTIIQIAPGEILRFDGAQMLSASGPVYRFWLKDKYAHRADMPLWHQVFLSAEQIESLQTV